MNFVIGIDIDGVLSDIACHLVASIKDRFGYDLVIDDLTSEDIETCTDVSAEELKEIFSSPIFFQTLPLIPGAHTLLKNLRDNGWKVILMTDRFWYSGIQKDTSEWLKTHNLVYEELHFVRKADKENMARELEIEFFIEDQLSNANSLARACKGVYLIDRSYNQGLVAESVLRVTCIDEVASLLTAHLTHAVATT